MFPDKKRKSIRLFKAKDVAKCTCIAITKQQFGKRAMLLWRACRVGLDAPFSKPSFSLLRVLISQEKAEVEVVPLGGSKNGKTNLHTYLIISWKQAGVVVRNIPTLQHSLQSQGVPFLSSSSAAQSAEAKHYLFWCRGAHRLHSLDWKNILSNIKY